MAMPHGMPVLHQQVDTPAAAVPGNQNAPPEQPANQRRPDQPVRMNAQGGMVLDDDDEDGMQRDWLDWVYTLCRLAVLLSIVYFYSTLGRFVIVVGFFFIVYL